MTQPTNTLPLMVNASIEAGKAILDIYDLPDLGIKFKEDQSPLTLADIAASDVINKYLEKTAYPIISEENKQLAYAARKDWDTCWIVDPLDGTKEFIKRNGEFTVNIALINQGAPVLGVIYVPVTRELYYADVTQKEAYKTLCGKDHSFTGDMFLEKDRILPSSMPTKKVRVVGSRSHMNQDTLDYISNLEKENKEVAIVSKGSSLKFCLVAEGKADLYPRFAPTMEWDTAAGHAICKAVGLRVIDPEYTRRTQVQQGKSVKPLFFGLSMIVASSHKRHLAKTITWRIVGTIDTILLAWIITGNPLTGLKIGGAEVITKMILYYIHERVWFNIGVKESQKRHLLKTITWRFIGTLDTFLISWFISGNPLTGLKIGVAEVVTKMILYYLHERGWYRINFGLDQRKKRKAWKKTL